MIDAPRHDWQFYQDRTRSSDAAWLRGLTTAERFDIYASLFNTLWSARRSLPGDWERLEGRRWEEKLRLRTRIVGAFHKLDELRRERSAANHAN